MRTWAWKMVRDIPTARTYAILEITSQTISEVQRNKRFLGKTSYHGFCRKFQYLFMFSLLFMCFQVLLKLFQVFLCVSKVFQVFIKSNLCGLGSSIVCIGWILLPLSPLVLVPALVVPRTRLIILIWVVPSVPGVEQG